MSETRLLAFGLQPEQFLDRQPEIGAFVDPSESASIIELTETLSAALDGGAYVLAVYPWWLPEDSLAALESARSLLDKHRVAVHRTALPPLAGAVLVSLAAAFAKHLPSPGLAAAILPQLEVELYVFTWLGSVASLAEPAPSPAQRAASMIPGSEFAVSSWPEPRVHRLVKEDRSIPTPELSHSIRLAVSSQGVESSWATEVVAKDLGGPPVVEVEPTPHGPEWWGTRKLVECVVYPDKVNKTLATTLSQDLEAVECRWCGELIASSPCPFCGAAAARE